MAKIEIVACTDKRFVMPTGVMMQSVCINNKDVEVVFHIIYDDSLNSEDKRDLENIAAGFEEKSVLFYHVDATGFPRFQNINTEIRISQAAYYRLMLSEILPKTIHKVLYLDGDIIVRHSLLPLWNIDLKDHPVGVVTDGIEGDLEHYRRLNYPPQLGYFNSGVILVNLEYWREHDVVSTFLNYLQEHADKIIYHDQDVLNAIFSDNKVVLPIKYNLTCGFLWKTPQYDDSKYKEELVEALRDPVIVHFAGCKPWDRSRKNQGHPFASTFFKYQSQTKWKGVKTDERPYKLRVINYVADMLRKYGLKSPLPHSEREFFDIAPIDA